MDKLNDFETTTDVLYSALKVPFLLYIRSLGADISSSSSIIIKQHEKKLKVFHHIGPPFIQKAEKIMRCVYKMCIFCGIFFSSPLPMSLFVSQQ